MNHIANAGLHLGGQVELASLDKLLTLELPCHVLTHTNLYTITPLTLKNLILPPLELIF